MMTSETEQNNAFSSRHGLIEFLADTVILHRYVRSSDLTDVHLALEVVKMRMSALSREIKPVRDRADAGNGVFGSERVLMHSLFVR